LEHRPILVGALSDRGVVAACSYETRGFGVLPAHAYENGQGTLPQRPYCHKKGNAGKLQASIPIS